MKNFYEAFERTLGHEGGYVNDLEDPGGETNWGISKRSYPGLDIAALTVEDAKNIYRRDYWDRIKLGYLTSGVIAGEIFDTAVNTGHKTAVKIAQRALNYLGETMAEDGLMGPVTVDTLNKWSDKDERALFVCLNGFQFMHYYSIVEKNPRLRRFARGWMKRIQQYREV